MSDYISLPSVKCLYFKESGYIYKMIGSTPMFRDPIHLENVDKPWIKSLSKEDKKKIEKDLKKNEKNERPNRETDTRLRRSKASQHSEV
jgi:hypothetical protein